MVELDNLDKRRRSSGGRLSGCVSGSILLRREDEVEGSVKCRESLAWRGADDFSVSFDSREAAGPKVFFDGDLLWELDAFAGDAGSERGCVCRGWVKSHSSTLESGIRFFDVEVDGFLLPLKNFILSEALNRFARESGTGQTKLRQGSPETRLCWICMYLNSKGGWQLLIRVFKV